MSPTGWLFISVFIALLLGWRHLHARRLVSQRNAQLTERQGAIQAALDRAGAVLKDENTSLEAGEIAAAQVLHDLQALNQDGSLRELIADTERFVEEWRASKRPA